MIGEFAWSPDGQGVAYQAFGGIAVTTPGQGRACLQLLEPRAVPGTRGTSGPSVSDVVWSPEGERAVVPGWFVPDSSRAAGPSPRPGPSLRQGAGLALADLDPDAAPTPLTDPQGDRFDVDPAWGPDGQRVAFRRTTSEPAGSSVNVVDVRTREVRTLLEREGRFEVGPVWTASGAWLAVASERALHLVSADGQQRRTVELGGAVQTVDPSPTEALIAVVTDRRLVLVSPQGGRPRPVGDLPGVAGLAWSPRGTFLAVTAGGQLAQPAALHRVEASTADVTRLASPRDEVELSQRPTATGRSTAWSPDGEHITFEASASDGAIVPQRSSDVFVVDVRGSDLRQITDSGEAHDPAFRPQPQ